VPSIKRPLVQTFVSIPFSSLSTLFSSLSSLSFFTIRDRLAASPAFHFLPFCHSTMKIACLFAAISVFVSVSAAATLQKDNVGQDRQTNSSNTINVRAQAQGNGNKGSNGATSNANKGGNGDAQSSLTLDPKVLAAGFKNDGQDVPAAGQVASLTSSNNFINFCLTVSNLPITNGKQVATGSCNPAPMGVIPSKDNMPSAKFVFPPNGDATIKENEKFTITMKIQNFQAGAFTNADDNYFAAPQQVNGQGQIIGHSHVVVEALSALNQITPTDPQKFTFFKGLNSAAQNGILSADVTAGLPAGNYKLSSINTAANHQPVLVPVAQHGSLDDAVYFTVVKAKGAAPPTGNSGNSNKGKQGK